MPYLDTFREETRGTKFGSESNWTTQEQVLPISLQSIPFDSK